MLRKWIASTAVGAVLASALTIVVGVASPAVAVAAPGTPGTPQAGTVIYNEGFENTGLPPVMIDQYTGSNGLRYTADASWRDPNQCNGIITRSDSPDLAGSCNYLNAAASARAGIRYLAGVLGTVNGSGRRTTRCPPTPRATRAPTSSSSRPSTPCPCRRR